MNAVPLAAFALVGAVAVLTIPALHPQDQIIGTAQIIDGDSIIVADQRIRLSGIDAPEILQTCAADNGDLWACGESAKAELAKIIGNEPVSCRPVDRDRYERIVAICNVGEIDIGQAMVNGGWAVAYTKYSSRYVADEQAARLTRRGIWRGRFVEPELWRREHQR